MSLVVPWMGKPARWAGVVALSCVFFSVFGAALASSASATSPVPEVTYAPNGPVLATARLGNTIYLGGNFSQVGPVTGTWAALSTSSGQVDTAMPKVAGGFPELVPAVLAVVADGAGGWYVGGSFTSVGGASP
jgi:hypothetical protein